MINHGFITYPAKLTGNGYKENGKIKKKFSTILGKKSHENEVKEDYNAYCMLTGEKAGLTVIDLDDMESDNCKTILREASVLERNKEVIIVKTANGFHIYCGYTPLLQAGVYNELGFDILNSEARDVIGAGCNYFHKEENKMMGYIPVHAVCVGEDEDGYDINEYTPYTVNEIDMSFRKVGNSSSLVGYIESLLPNKKTQRQKDCKPLKGSERYDDIVEACLSLELGDYQYAVTRQDDGNFKISVSGSFMCIVEKTYPHDGYHNCIYINKPTRNGANCVVVFNCLGKHGGRQINNSRSVADKNIVKRLHEVCLKYFTEQTKSDSGKSYEEVKEEFELENFKLADEFVCTRGVIKSYKKTNFNTLHEELTYIEEANGTKIKKPFLTRWFRDENKRRYERFVFQPNLSLVTEEEYNTFEGFDVIKHKLPYDFGERDKLIEPFIKLFREDCCDDNSSLFEYVIRWFANIFAFPYKMSRVALVCRGEEGVGKGTISKLIRKMIGKSQSIAEGNVENIFDKHSTTIESKLFVHFDEFNTQGKASYINQLKNMITEDTHVFNPKNLHSYSLNNYANFYICSNDLNPVSRDGKSRRFCCIEFSSRHINNTTYWSELESAINNWQRLSAFYDYLMEIADIDFDFENSKIQTAEQNNYTVSPFNLWLQYLYDNVEMWTDGVREESGNTLMGWYRSHLNYNHFKNDDVNSNNFGRLLNNTKIFEKKHTKTGCKYSFERPSIKEYLVKQKCFEEVDEEEK
jgi:hypothetical protein